MTAPGSAAEGPTRRAVLLSAAGLTLAACTEGDALREAATEPAPAGRAAGRAPVAPGLDGSAVVDVAGVPLGFRRLGAGRAIVLIHGASGNRRDWPEAALAAFAARGEAVAFDRPGHGDSGWPGPAGAALAEQARRMRGALAGLGIGRATLVGHSYGGSVALAWALDAPESVDGLLLIAAPSQVWPGGLGLATDLLASPLTGPALAHALPVLLPRAAADAAAARVFAPQSPPPGYLDRVGIDRVLKPATLRANALQLAALKTQIAAMAPRYPGLAMPVVLVHGTADTTVPLDIHSGPTAAQAPRARLVRLDGIGHMPHHVALPEVLAAFDRLPP